MLVARPRHAMNHFLLEPVVVATSFKSYAPRVRATWGVLKEFADWVCHDCAAVSLGRAGGRAPKSLFAIDNCRRHRPKQGQIRRLFHFLCPPIARRRQLETKPVDQLEGIPTWPLARRRSWMR